MFAGLGLAALLGGIEVLLVILLRVGPLDESLYQDLKLTMPCR